jgi:hypothetical protein
MHHCWLLNTEKNEISPTGNAGFDKIDISRLGPLVCLLLFY